VPSKSTIGSDPRFKTPIPIDRPYKSNRFDFWSPKLRREVTIYGHLSFLAAINIEANPQVISYCEYPFAVQSGKNQIDVVHFWIAKSETEEAWLLHSSNPQDADGTHDSHPALVTWAAHQKIELRSICREQLKREEPWFSNWTEILSYLSVGLQLLPSTLKIRVLDNCHSTTTLATLERTLPKEDPVLVRSAVFTLVHSGLVTCTNLDKIPLSPQTEFLATS
jgi:hypothetical protein